MLTLKHVKGTQSMYLHFSRLSNNPQTLSLVKNLMEPSQVLGQILIFLVRAQGTFPWYSLWLNNSTEYKIRNCFFEMIIKSNRVTYHTAGHLKYRLMWNQNNMFSFQNCSKMLTFKVNIWWMTLVRNRSVSTIVLIQEYHLFIYGTPAPTRRAK